MIVVGVMSGTSADGIDVAIAEIMGRGFTLRYKLLHHHHANYPAAVRKAVLAAMNAQDASVADLSRLNFTLGEIYADAVNAVPQTSQGGQAAPQAGPRRLSWADGLPPGRSRGVSREEDCLHLAARRRCARGRAHRTARHQRFPSR